MAQTPLTIRIGQGRRRVDVAATLVVAGGRRPRVGTRSAARRACACSPRRSPSYLFQLVEPVSPGAFAAVSAATLHLVEVRFAGRSPVRRKLLTPVDGQPATAPPPVAAAASTVDLTSSRPGAAPLFLCADGSFSTRGDGVGPRGMAALSAW